LILGQVSNPAQSATKHCRKEKGKLLQICAQENPWIIPPLDLSKLISGGGVRLLKMATTAAESAVATLALNNLGGKWGIRDVRRHRKWPGKRLFLSGKLKNKRS
jgi:hypothetical protein